MKKSLITFALLLSGLTAGAQEWRQVSMHDADGAFVADKAWEYHQDGMGSFILWSYQKPRFCLKTEAGDPIIRIDRHKYVTYLGTAVTVELYDSCKVLQKSFHMWLDYDSISRTFTTRNDSRKIPSPRQGRRVRSIFKALQTGGYVCFYARRPGHYPLDLMVAPRKEQK